MNILVCEKLLFRYKLSDNSSCIYCAKEHSMEHLLYSCKEASEFWKNASPLLHMNVTYKHIVLGNNDKQFSVGANLMNIGMMAMQQNFGEIEEFLVGFQKILMKMN